MRILRPWFQRWDSKLALELMTYIANSYHVQKRIKKYYQKEATVIHPPVDTKRFKSRSEIKNDYFLIVSAFAPYKRVDLAVEAFNKLGYPFVVVGDGQDAESVTKNGEF